MPDIPVRLRVVASTQGKGSCLSSGMEIAQIVPFGAFLLLPTPSLFPAKTSSPGSRVRGGLSGASPPTPALRVSAGLFIPVR